MAFRAPVEQAQPGHALGVGFKLLLHAGGHAKAREIHLLVAAD